MGHILLLNMSFEPLAVITQKRAASLILRGRVEAACAESIEVQSVSAKLRIPTVIRLRRYINVPQRGVCWSRRAVLRRDKYTCAYCGLQPGNHQRGQTLTKYSFTIDHIIPVSRGGKNTWGNTICACPVCNQRKGNRTPHEANMKLRWEPKMPRVNYLVVSGEIPASWKVYLAMSGQSAD
ncbi:MAG: HNH endonuclease [Anaerolineae bacterium]|nr:HNH endonuclease [Anaerolineae bacterium]